MSWVDLWDTGQTATSSELSDDLPALTMGEPLVDPLLLAGARGIKVADSYGYVAVWNDGAGNPPVGAGQGRLAIIDFADDDPKLIVSIQHDLIRGARGLDVMGDIVALVSSLSGGTLTLWNVTDRTTPVLLRSSTDVRLTGAHRAEFVGRWLYVTGLNYFTIWDPFDLTNPVGALDVTGDDLYGMAIKGDVAFLAASAANEYISVNITDRANPVEISRVSLPGSGPHWMTVDGRYGYTANSGTDSVDIVDVSDPAAMVVVGTTGSDSRLNGAHTLAKLGDYLLVCSQSYSGFAVVQVTNPAAPVVVGSVFDTAVMDGVRSMHVVGSRCYWAAPGPQATPFTTGSVGWIDLHGLNVSSMTVGALRADEAETRGEHVVGSLTAMDGGTFGPGGIAVVGAAAFANGMALVEQASPPAAPVGNSAVMWVEDNGAGKTRLMVEFATGGPIQLEIEP